MEPSANDLGYDADDADDASPLLNRTGPGRARPREPQAPLRRDCVGRRPRALMDPHAGLRSIEHVHERLAEEGLAAQTWSNGPGDRYAVHDHGYDKVLVAATGSIMFSLPASGRTVELIAGDRLDLPAGTAHGALVGPDGVCCLEAHLPRGSLSGMPRHLPGWASRARGSSGKTADEQMA